MSDSASLIKLGYRGIAGFFVGLFLFTLGVTGGALAFSGGVILALSWVPAVYPEIVEYGTIEGTGAQFLIDNPELLTPLLIVIGLILVGVGFLLLLLTYTLGKGAIIVDKEISSVIDRNFRSKDRLTQLERLASLKERGILTEEQFEAERIRILSTPVDEKYKNIP
ncbi:MAG: SHOCT domain-containing protein [Candidatus Hodarchaeales archaeon]|jgi:hypothetical protein